MSKIAFIIGAGRNVGASAAALFAKSGYQVATASRSATSPFPDGAYHVQLDLSEPSGLDLAFDKVVQKFGAPSVVIYNAAALTRKENDSLFDISVEEFTRDFAINTTSVFAAARAAYKHRKDFTFIYTGNMLNIKVVPRLMTCGLGKAASAHMLEALAAQYNSEGARFYYADERHEDGEPAVSGVDGEGHAQYFLELAETKEQKPVISTFVSGRGHVNFTEVPKWPGK